MCKKISIFILFCSLSVLGLAQTTATYLSLQKDYSRGLELFDKEKYVPASEAFQQILTKIYAQNTTVENKDWDLLRINTEYYFGQCALELFNNSAEDNLLDFAEKFPENPRARSAYFSLARFNFREKNYDTAMYWYSKVDEFGISENQLAEYNFKYGYCLFYKKQNDKAAEKFGGVMDLTSKYAYPSRYYYGYIAYAKKDYKTALDNFLKLKESKVYYETAVNFCLQLYYLAGKYDELIKFGKAVIEEHKITNEVLLHNYLAKAYYRKEDFNNCIKEYNTYFNLDTNAGTPTQEWYEKGYAHYAQTETREAEAEWKKLSAANDAYAQNALYGLGAMLLETKDYNAARDAFKQSATIGIDKVSKEKAEFQYAKLSQQLQFYQVAVDGLQSFIKNYPKSIYNKEAKAILGEALLSTKKYSDALAVIEKIEPRTPELNRAYQAAAYYHGVEIYNDKNLAAAVELFEKAISNPVDNQIFALANYWKGEALYSQKKYTEAIVCYKSYNANNDNSGTGIYSNVNYNLAYCSFEKEDYGTALFYFDKFLNVENKDSRLYADALLRFADCNFIQKNYDKSLFYYNKVITEKKPNADYALLQKSIITGLQSRLADKVITLQELLKAYPESIYADDARYEIAQAYFNLGDTKNAQLEFEKISTQFPNSQYIAKSKLSLGLIYFNNNQDQKAIEAYKLIMTEYPSTEEAKEALQAIKNIYIENGRADEYISFLGTVPNANISTGILDSTTYEAAYNLYARNDCNGAIVAFNNYFEKYPEGYYSMDAHYQRAECLVKNKQNDLALIDYDILATKFFGKYTEKAILSAARISLDFKNYDKTISYYKRGETESLTKEGLKECLIGLMKCYYEQKNYTDALNYAEKVIINEKVNTDEQFVAKVIKAKCLYFTGNAKVAAETFGTISLTTKTESGAESQYYIALIQYEAKNYEESKKICFELSRQIPSYDYWIAKAFILLSDNYVAQNNKFQAKSTLQSILDEYQGNDDILPTAKEKLEKLF